MRHICAAAVASLALGLVAYAQAPTFEVASIKRNASGSSNSSSRALPGGRITMTNRTLRDMVREVYRLQGFQITGGPDWIGTDRWDIVAKADGEQTFERLVPMMQNLFADRFKLVIHREQREQPIFALVFARTDHQLGAQIHPSSVDCDAMAKTAAARGDTSPRAANGRPLCGINMTNGKLMTSATTLAELTRLLSGTAGRSIVDKTGLAGRFDIDLSWTPEQSAGGGDPVPPASDGASLFTAMQEQLGLKLEPQRGPVDMLVIDSAARPTED
jgi:uncharacterized protein (TIGR03435 family)